MSVAERWHDLLEIRPKTEITISGKPDRIFHSPRFPRPFCFNEQVAEVFDDMVSRSVPFYRETIEALIYWTARHYQLGSRIYDLGCSTATTMDALFRAMPKQLEIVGIDNSSAMLAKADEKLQSLQGEKYELICSDLETVLLENASIAIMNYTLQFVAVRERRSLLKKIFDSLKPGGLLFLSEKVRSEDPIVQETVTSIYEDFKLRQGYSSDEISRKKEALDNVLVPLTEKEQTQMLLSAGFQSVNIVLKWNNFTTFAVMKS